VQLAAIAHSRLWHIATLRYDAQIRSLLEALRTCHERHERSGATRLTLNRHKREFFAAVHSALIIQ